MDNIENFERKTATISLCGKEVTMRTMSARAILKAIKTITKHKAEILAELKLEHTDMEAIVAILCACEASLPELLSATTGADISNEIADNITLIELSKIAEIFVQLNDFSAVRENFTHAAAVFAKQLPQKKA